MSHQLLVVLFVGSSLTFQNAEALPPSLEDSPTRLVPREKRDEAGEDRLAAAAAFAHARLLVQRGERHKALRQFQRAWRYDPQAVSISREIVPLAAGLRRQQEAARYAVLAAERNPDNPKLMRQLGALLVEQNDLPRAVRLFAAVLELSNDSPPNADSVALRLEMGRLYFILDDAEKAAESFAVVRAALIDPDQFGLDEAQRERMFRDPTLLYTLMAEGFLKAKRYEEALDMFDRAHKESNDDPLLALNTARVHAAQEEWKPASEQLEKYLQAKASSGGQQPYQLLQQLMQRESSDEAQADAALLKRLQELHLGDPTNIQLGYFLAGRLLAAEDWDGSEALYAELILRRPATDAFRGLAKIYHQQKEIDKLLDLVRHAVEKTDNLDLLGSAARRLAQDESLLPKLITLARTRMRDEPDAIDQDARLGMAYLAIAAENYKVADEFYAGALEVEGREKLPIMETFGLILYLDGEAERAVQIFRQALAENPPAEKSAAYYYYLAGALESAGKTDEALREARRAAALRPQTAQYHARAPWVLYHAKRYGEATEAYEQLIKRFDEDYETNNARNVARETRLILSNICVIEKRIPEAIEWLEEILDEFPEDVGALNDLGYLWADEGIHLERALRMVTQAVDQEPENVAYRDSLGWAYYRLGRYGDAVRELERAVAADEPDGVILDHLGDAYLKAGERQKALDSWQRAAKLLREQEDASLLEKTEAKIQELADRP